MTTTLKLGTGITLVPERNPLLLAKEIATLDYYSGGRFLFGIGAGWHKEETAIMGGGFANRWTQTREAVEAMQQLWAHDAAEYHGRFYDFPPVRSYPRPVYAPIRPSFSVAQHPVCSNGRSPMAMAGCTRSTPELIQRRRNTLNELAAEAGRDPASIKVMAYIAPADRAKLQALADAGADAACCCSRAPEHAALAELEEMAQKVL